MLRNRCGSFDRDEVTGVQTNELGIGDQVGRTASKGFRQHIAGTVDDQRWALEVPQDRGEFLKNNPGLAPANQPHQFPGSGNTGECLEETLPLNCVLRAGYSPGHYETPEHRIYERSGKFAQNGLAQQVEQKERLQVRENRGRKQCEAVDSLGNKWEYCTAIAEPPSCPTTCQRRT